MRTDSDAAAAPGLLTRTAALLGLLLAAACSETPAPAREWLFQGDLPVGILHSRTGTMAVSEDSCIAGELLALEEVNASGGLVVGGRRLRLKPLIRDGASRPEVFATAARELVATDRVAVVFGGWTSSSRQAMLPAFAGGESLLFYPIQYEGQERADNVIYFGATPNQQSVPALAWLLARGHRDFVLVGSDYVYPRTANAIARAQLLAAGARVAAELYLPLGAPADAGLIDAIRGALPAGGIIVNTINGDSNESFFRGLHADWLLPQNGYRVLSFSIDEATISQYGARYFAGSYVSQGYFESLDTAESRRFVSDFRRRFGSTRPVGEPAVAGYTMVRAWAAAVARAGDPAPQAVARALQGVAMSSPAGPVAVLPNRHTTKNMRLGEVRGDGSIAVVADLGTVEPEPFSRYLAPAR